MFMSPTDVHNIQFSEALNVERLDAEFFWKKIRLEV